MLSLKKDGVVLLVALIIGIIFVLPHVLIPLFLGGEYNLFAVKNVNPFSVDETYYASNIRDVYDGHLIVRDSQLYEYKESPAITTPIFPYAVLGVFTFFTGSVQITFILSDFIFPVIIFLLVYLFLFLFTRNRIISILGGVSIFQVNWLLQYIPFFDKLVFEVIRTDVIRPFSYFSRLPFVEFTFVGLIVSIIFFYLAIENGRRLYKILAGVSIGLLFYSYFYYWTYMAVFLASVFSIFFLKKMYEKRSFNIYLIKDSPVLKTIITVSFIAFIVSIPFWIDFIHFRDLGYSDDVMGRAGIESGRTLNMNTTIKYIIFLSLFYYLVKNRDNRFYFLVSFPIAGILIMNIQLVTGYTVQSSHWSTTAVAPMIVIMLCYLLHQLINTHYSKKMNRVLFPLKKYYKPICAFLIIFLISYGFYHNYNYSKNTYQGFVLPENTIETYDWLTANTEKDAVVMSASIENVFLMPVYTHNNNFIPNAYLTQAPTDEIIERMLITYAVINVSEDYLGYLLSQDNAVVERYHRPLEMGLAVNESLFETALWNTVLFHRKFHFSRNYLPDIYEYPEDIRERAMEGEILFIPFEVRDSILEKYREYSEIDLNELLTKYRVDYLYFGPYEKQISNIDISKYEQFYKVWENGDISIYRIIIPI